MDAPPLTTSWVLLTMGDRPAALRAAVSSLVDRLGVGDEVVVVANGTRLDDPPSGVRVVQSETNIGIPAGRNLGARGTRGDVVGFLDDDAVASPAVVDGVRTAFDRDPGLGALALRLVDEQGVTARRHVPRLGGDGATEPGEVALFLGGACAIRRTALDDVGGYWDDLVYGHEELELAWRLVDRGWKIEYAPDLTVFHPRTEIGRHAEGWRMTGRNRVMIARRTLPWPVAVVHALAWLIVGAWRAPSEHRRSYVDGWRAGWRHPVAHRPIRWRTVVRLGRLGRPPMI